MRVLHVVKTTDGAEWAAWLAAELALAGVEVHVALPADTGLYIDDWRGWRDDTRCTAGFPRVGAMAVARDPLSRPEACG
jgi:hypothetical protein